MLTYLDIYCPASFGVLPLPTPVVSIDPTPSSKGLASACWGLPWGELILLAELAKVLLVTIIVRLLPAEWGIVLRLILRRPTLGMERSEHYQFPTQRGYPD